MHHPAAQSEAGRSRAQSRTRPSACAPASPRRRYTWPRRFATTASARLSFCSTPTRGDDDAEFAFIEANPRLQVEHTVTEEVTGIDLVKLQLQLAGGSTLTELGLRQADIPQPRGFAIQMRINMESMSADGTAKPSGGTLTRVRSRRRGPACASTRSPTPVTRPIRTSTRCWPSLSRTRRRRISPRPSRGVSRTERVPDRGRRNQSRISPEPAAASRFRREPALHALRRGTHRRACRRGEFNSAPALFRRRVRRGQAGPSGRAQAIAGFRQIGRGQNRLDRSAGGAEPWQERGQFDAGSTPAARAATAENDDRAHHEITGPENTVAVAAPMQGTIVSIDVREGELVRQGQQLFVMEAMKMEHVIRAHTSGVVRRIAVAERDAIFEGHPLAFIEEAEVRNSRGRRGRKSRPRPYPPRPGRGDTSAMPKGSTPRGPRRSRAGAKPISAPRAKTSRTSATRAPSSSTGRWCSQRSAAAARSTT